MIASPSYKEFDKEKYEKTYKQSYASKTAKVNISIGLLNRQILKK